MRTVQGVLEKTLTIGNQFGLHARVATEVAKTLQGFACRVTIAKDGREADARSVLELLLLAAEAGSKIVVRADGPDSKEALLEIGRLVHHD